MMIHALTLQYKAEVVKSYCSAAMSLRKAPRNSLRALRVSPKIRETLERKDVSWEPGRLAVWTALLGRMHFHCESARLWLTQAHALNQDFAIGLCDGRRCRAGRG
jgi:hypothetical protein